MSRGATWRRGLVLLLPGSLLGCGYVPGAASCEAFFSSYPVAYFGGAQGLGEISLRAAPAQPGVVELGLTLFEATPDSSEPALTLQGVGSCVAGTTRIRLGAGGENDQVRVLGGSVVGIFDPEVTEQPFGRWEVLLHTKADEREVPVAGFWQVARHATFDALQHEGSAAVPSASTEAPGAAAEAEVASTPSGS